MDEKNFTPLGKITVIVKFSIIKKQSFDTFSSKPIGKNNEIDLKFVYSYLWIKSKYHKLSKIKRAADLE